LISCGDQYTKGFISDNWFAVSEKSGKSQGICFVLMAGNLEFLAVFPTVLEHCLDWA